MYYSSLHFCFHSRGCGTGIFMTFIYATIFYIISDSTDVKNYKEILSNNVHATITEVVHTSPFFQRLSRKLIVAKHYYEQALKGKLHEHDDLEYLETTSLNSTIDLTNQSNAGNEIRSVDIWIILFLELYDNYWHWNLLFLFVKI